MVDFYRSVGQALLAPKLADDISPPDTGPYDVLGQLTPGQIADMRADEEARKRLPTKKPRTSMLMLRRWIVNPAQAAKAEWN